jgi:hypothetical protein
MNRATVNKMIRREFVFWIVGLSSGGLYLIISAST